MIKIILAIILCIASMDDLGASFKTRKQSIGRPRFKKETTGTVYFGGSVGIVYANNIDLQPSIIKSCGSACGIKVHNRPYFEGFVGYVPASLPKLRIECSFLGFKSKITTLTPFNATNTLNVINDNRTVSSFDQVSATIGHSRVMLSLYYNEQFKSGGSGYFFGGGLGIGNLYEKIIATSSISSNSQDFSAKKNGAPMFEIAGGFFTIPLDGFVLQIKLRYTSSIHKNYGPTYSDRYNYIGLDIGLLVPI